MKTKIKICGIKDKDIANLCVDLGVDYLGFNFSPVSKRRVDLEIASDILNHLDRHNNRYFKIVALFYKNTIEDIQTTISSLTIDFIQYVVEDKTVDLETIQAYNIPLIPQIAVSQKIEDMHLSRYKSDFVILDSYKKGMGGGTGATFNWELIWSVSRKYFSNILHDKFSS